MKKMIRITKSSNRSTEDYLVLALILHQGLETMCKNSCEDCIAKGVCKSVKSATRYAVKLAGLDLVYLDHK